MANPPLEIERRFLVKPFPRNLAVLPGKEIQQGYIVVDDQREVRIRRAGRACTLTVKEGTGLIRQETETAITGAQFEALWPLTEGRRIEKIRRRISLGEVTLELDRFHGPLRPLCIAEVEFPSPEQAEAFVPPAYCKEEITGRSEYKNANLALSGLPHPNINRIRIAALPFLFKKGELHLVLVTNSSGNKWILPKGHPEPHLPRGEVALLEAVEEAGVIGVLSHGLRGRCTLSNGQVHHIYPMKVSTLLTQWPEVRRRKRRVLPLQKALGKLSDEHLTGCVLRLADRLQSS